jgi:DNA-binding XRE family transcriptional regulator
MTESTTPSEGFPEANHATRHANMLGRALKRFRDNLNLSDPQALAEKCSLLGKELESLAETLSHRSDLNTLAENVRRAREEMGMTPDDLAELSGVDQATISLIEGGRITPDCVDVANIAEALNTTTKVLLMRTTTTQSRNRDQWQMN